MIVPPSIDASSQTPIAELTLFAQRRAAIDTIATTRATVIRCGLFGTYLYRPNPLREDTQDVKDSWIAEMHTQMQKIQRAAALIAGNDPLNEIPVEICSWLAVTAAAQPKQVAVLKEMVSKTDNLIKATSEGGHRMEKLLIDHAVYGRKDFFPAISQLCDAFWSDLDQQRHREVQQAQEANSATAATLTRLEQIGRHVRLVSLNASVEAARVGDAGKGLGVIAQEFKSLAEEIQFLAVSARADIDAIIQSPN